jgi:hypothetical protein
MQAMARVSLFGTPRGSQSPCQNEMDMPGIPLVDGRDVRRARKSRL